MPVNRHDDKGDIMRLVLKLAFAFSVLVTGAAAQAQLYPNRPISMIVPFAPGGIADITGRDRKSVV